jgi:hypothetical protein
MSCGVLPAQQLNAIRKELGNRTAHVRWRNTGKVAKKELPRGPAGRRTGGGTPGADDPSSRNIPWPPPIWTDPRPDWFEGTEDNLDIKKARESSTRTITVWKNRRGASSSTWPSGSSNPTARAPSFALPAPRGRARPPWASPSPVPWGGNSSASPWAASGTKRRSGATAGPTSGPSRAASSRVCAVPRRTTRSLCSPKSTRWAATSVATPRRPPGGPGSGPNFSFMDHYWTCVRFVPRDVHHHGQCPGHDPPGPARPPGIIELVSSTQEEKLSIARRYLIPRRSRKTADTVPDHLHEGGHPADHCRLYPGGGVRNWSGRSPRSAGRGHAIAEGTLERAIIRMKDVQRYLGHERVIAETAARTAKPGWVMGLAWTPREGTSSSSRPHP